MPNPRKLTPMMQQYFDIKRQCPEAILMYRMGDFYEMFFEDAERAAPILNIALTSRNKSAVIEAPMCGVPHHSADAYVGKLLAAGLKVAICDQVEDARDAKGLVRREIVRLVTPGTVTAGALLEEKRGSYLCALALAGDREDAALAALDVSTGEFFVVPLENARGAWPQSPDPSDKGDPGGWLDRLAAELEILQARELLVGVADEPVVRGHAGMARLLAEGLTISVLAADADLSSRRAAAFLGDHFGVASLTGFGLPGEGALLTSAARVLAYARDTQRVVLVNVVDVAVRRDEGSMFLDATSQRNLELFASARDGGRAATLLAVMDRTLTSMGGRLLRAWIGRPLARLEPIAARHEAVAALTEDGAARRGWREALGGVADLERLGSRIALGVANPRDFAQLRESLARLPGLRELLCGSPAGRSAELAVALDPLPQLHAEIVRVLADAPPLSRSEPGLIRAGVCAELDDLRSLARDSKKVILGIEEEERRRTGIANLRVRYNRVFGYSIEVSKGQIGKVPADYQRRQTLVGAERYSTPELKELEERILGAEDRILTLEGEFFAALAATAAREVPRLVRTARAVAEADVLASFAETAVEHRFVRPRMTAANVLDIRDGRHPVVESLAAHPFIANDTSMTAPSGVGERTPSGEPEEEVDGGEAGAQIIVLTGPNMGGKSTYLRQVALIVLLAHAGSFVPASAATIGLTDRVFCRVGASDDLARGESTFMVEMLETANILRHATPRSLVILDEVGRGTATFDGLSLAWAIVEHLHDTPRRAAKTLFATHYHELTELALVLQRVANFTLAVKEWNEEILFLRRVVPGAANKSYGLDVAKLAGMPASVLARAREVLANLENKELDIQGMPRLARHAGETPAAPAQLVLFKTPGEIVLETLRDAELDELTPIAALNLLHSLKRQLH